MNEAGRRFQIHDYGGYIAGGLPRVELSRRALLTTDIPGQAGYTGYAPLGYDQDDDAFAYAYDPLQGAFTLFGGTSGASSIVAGLTALMTRRAKMSGKQLSGSQFKDILIATCKSKAETLKPDNINGQNPAPDMRALFGGGLVDAGAAIAR